MKARTIISLLLGAFVIASVAVLIVKEIRPPAGGAAREPLPQNGVVVYYFHTAARCEGCEELRLWTKEALERDLGGPLARGVLHWRPVNTEEKANRHFVREYDLTALAVVMVEFRNGRQARWRNLDRIWDFRNDRAGLQRYVVREVEGFLKDAG